MKTETVKVRTCMAGVKKWCWRKNLKGFFTHNGKDLSDQEVRNLVNYCIDKGYETDGDLPEEEIEQALNYNK